jgi:SAM-dependent methyltransferase
MKGQSKYHGSAMLAELYDLVPAYSNRPDKKFYIEYCTAANGEILELGCGTGRILIPVAEAGCHITGLDISEHMLSNCRKKVETSESGISERVRLVEGDMTDFDLGSSFELVIIPFRGFQHLIDIRDQLSCLRSINRHLKEGRTLIIDLFQVDFDRINNPRLIAETEDLPEHSLPDGRKLRRTSRITSFHPAEQFNDVELIYYVTDTGGTSTRVVDAFPFRYFFRYEVEHLLERCGFGLIDVFGDYDKSALGDASPEMIVVARKNRSIP